MEIGIPETIIKLPESMLSWRGKFFSNIRERIQNEYETTGEGTAWCACIGNNIASLSIINKDENIKNYLKQKGTYETVSREIMKLEDELELFTRKYPDRSSVVPQAEIDEWINKMENLQHYFY